MATKSVKPLHRTDNRLKSVLTDFAHNVQQMADSVSRDDLGRAMTEDEVVLTKMAIGYSVEGMASEMQMVLREGFKGDDHDKSDYIGNCHELLELVNDFI